MTHTAHDERRRDSATERWLRWAMLGAAAVVFALHFVHLNADFPNGSPWMDWSKYTDEGWYGDAAIRHYVTGHWYWKGDFNPAVALPMWPALELLFFRFTGVSAAAARVLALLVFGGALLAIYALLQRFSRGGPSLAAPMAVLLLCCSPFLYAFSRLAIVEPLLIALMTLALLLASHLRRERTVDPLGAALGVLLTAMVLTKTTAVFLFPAVGYMVWARAGYRVRATARMLAVPAVVAAVVWGAYFGLFVRPHYLEDYRYLFSANAYTGFELSAVTTVIGNTLSDGMWMGKVLYPLFFAVVALAIFWRRSLFRNPLFPALLLWAGGYGAFLAYHNNLQPRYYMVVAVPVTALVAMGLDHFREVSGRLAPAMVAVAVLGVVVPDAVMQTDFVLHPEYTFLAAANGIRRIVLAEPNHPRLVLSISGSDLTLMTGLPSIDDDFGTLELGDRVKLYRPGWYAAWNDVEDDKMDALTPLYSVTRVAAFPAMDDAERNLLILYRLDPKEASVVSKRVRKKLGQRLSAIQLAHRDVAGLLGKACPRGLKPRSVVGLDVRAEARTYLRSNSRSKSRGNGNGKRRFPSGMTNQKATATATAKAEATTTAEATAKADSLRE